MSNPANTSNRDFIFITVGLLHFCVCAFIELGAGAGEFVFSLTEHVAIPSMLPY
jgi:hypothetical protein